MTTEWYFRLKFNHHFSGDLSFCTYVNGRYEPNEMYAAANILRPGMSFVDVGANEGLFTLLASAVVGSSGAVHAFEPSPRERSRLESNIELNGLTNVHVHPVALGSEQQIGSLRVSNQEHPGQSTLGGFSYRETAEVYSVEVPVETLDHVVESERIDRIDLIKIDVEGSETAVLRGARESVRRFRPMIIVEAQETSLRQMGSSTLELMDLIRGFGYLIQAFGSAGDPEPVSGSAVQSVNLICGPAETAARPSAPQ